MRMTALIATVLALLSAPLAALAQETDELDRKPSHCLAVAQKTPGVEYLQKASFRDPMEPHTVRLHYIAHASFLIQTHGGTSAVTDYTGFIGNVDFIPDVVTMNHAHDTHWTPYPDPGIAHVLPGWGEEHGAGIEHHVDLGDVVVRNVSTDIRSPYGAGTEPKGNSIFVFEAAGLCIGHLGHLHHVPTEQQFAALGRVDVVMAPVDGGYTLSLPEMISVIKRLKSSIVIPMHWFGEPTLDRFLAGMDGVFPVVDTGLSTLKVSLDTLPAQPTIMVLRPTYLREPG
ncbi:MBL fold metallo-hydrolase [Roseovarius aestuariivivens]|uniref:MBL fold metallo-hydrolase n=1 Tax=Roseovarius aestuariivivens TaxID=1888910 RepID=UPI0010810938|nr:MBL fold metallo-hydrolase [Roseovarius aestuariivivens]